jgi:hypothetical protein
VARKTYLLPISEIGPGEVSRIVSAAPLRAANVLSRRVFFTTDLALDPYGAFKSMDSLVVPAVPPASRSVLLVMEFDVVDQRLPAAAFGARVVYEVHGTRHTADIWEYAVTLDTTTRSASPSRDLCDVTTAQPWSAPLELDATSRSGAS